MWTETRPGQAWDRPASAREGRTGKETPQAAGPAQVPDVERGRGGVCGADVPSGTCEGETRCSVSRPVGTRSCPGAELSDGAGKHVNGSTFQKCSICLREGLRDGGQHIWKTNISSSAFCLRPAPVSVFAHDRCFYREKATDPSCLPRILKSAGGCAP